MKCRSYCQFLIITEQEVRQLLLAIPGDQINSDTVGILTASVDDFCSRPYLFHCVVLILISILYMCALQYNEICSLFY